MEELDLKELFQIFWEKKVQIATNSCNFCNYRSNL